MPIQFNEENVGKILVVHVSGKLVKADYEHLVPEFERLFEQHGKSRVFLSGGQSAELASSRLDAMNVRFKGQLPWALSFSFARAIQQPALEIWQGKESNVEAAQNVLLHRSKCNRAARLGKYTVAMESAGV